MKSKEEQPDDVPKSKSAFRFLAGLGIGIFFGWLGTFFRRTPRPVEQTPATPGNTDFETNDALRQIVIAAIAPEPIGPVVSRTGSIPPQNFQIPFEDGPGSQSPPRETIVSTNSSRAETGANQQQNGAEEAVPSTPGHTPEWATSQSSYESAAFSTPPMELVPPAEDQGVSDDANGIQSLSADIVVSTDRPEAEYEPHRRLGGEEDTTKQLSLSGGIVEDTAASPVASATAESSQEESTVEQPATQEPPNPAILASPAGQGAAHFTESVYSRNSAQPFVQDSERRLTSPATYRPRPAEPADEYASSVADDLPSQYLKWNRWIIEHAIASIRKDGDVYLSITPTILAGIAAASDEFSTSPRDAETDFTAAVGAAYASIIIQEGRLRTLRRLDAQGHPVCVAFLAASVLAAYRMHSDEDASGGAYYYRFAKLLSCGLAAAGHPQGFDPAVFESLWIFLQTWLTDKKGARLAMPGLEASIRRFVALPLTHVPLRRLDIEKLPAFFVWAQYAAGARVPEKKLLFDLERWLRTYTSFSAAGTSALGDERRHAVVSQVAQELAAWDGSATESSGRRSASVELMLDIVRYRPDLFYLPRRPDGFPLHFDDGVHVFDAADEGWYEQLPLFPEAGSELAHGFEWRNIEDGSVSFRRPSAAVVPLAPHPDYSFFVSRSNLLRGAFCAVLCQDDLASMAAEYLSKITSRICTPTSHPNIPAGWKLFTNVRPERRADIPDGLDALDIDSQVNIICSGGLRLGRRREWLLGAPPKIVVTGLENDDVIKLDGDVVVLAHDGTLQTNGHLFEPGLHSVEAGGHRNTFEIVEPQISHATLPTRSDASHCVTLPPGRWTLLGAVPGQVISAVIAGRRGLICRADFDPVWAVSVGAGPGAVVVSIKVKSPQPDQAPRFKSKRRAYLQQWVSQIYDAAVRRPVLNSLSPTLSGDRIETIWTEYVRVAKQIKREWRKS